MKRWKFQCRWNLDFGIDISEVFRRWSLGNPDDAAKLSGEYQRAVDEAASELQCPSRTYHPLGENIIIAKKKIEPKHSKGHCNPFFVSN